MTTVTAKYLTMIRDRPIASLPPIGLTLPGRSYEIVDEYTARARTWYLIAAKGKEIGWVPRSARDVRTFREP